MKLPDKNLKVSHFLNFRPCHVTLFRWQPFTVTWAMFSSSFWLAASFPRVNMYSFKDLVHHDHLLWLLLLLEVVVVTLLTAFCGMCFGLWFYRVGRIIAKMCQVLRSKVYLVFICTCSGWRSYIKQDVATPNWPWKVSSYRYRRHSWIIMKSNNFLYQVFIICFCLQMVEIICKIHKLIVTMKYK